MRIPALLAAAVLLPLPLAATGTATAAAPHVPGRSTGHSANHTAVLGSPPATTRVTPRVEVDATTGATTPGSRPGSTRGAAPGTTAGSAPAAHRSAYGKDLSVSVSPPSFPTAPGGVGTVLVTVCNNGTETPTSASLVVNGPGDPGLSLAAGPFQEGPIDGGWNWIRFPVAQNLAPASCATYTVFATSLSTTPGPASYPGGTAEVDWDPSQNPTDNSTTWAFDTSAPVTNAVLELARPPKPTAPGNPADFEIVERNLGPSTDYPWRGQVVATVPPGSRFLSSAPDFRQCVISADGTTATCDDPVDNTWAFSNRGFALQVDPGATPGTGIPVTITQQAPANPDPHRFVLTVLIPVC
ncbi:hypothetical protein GCM10009665_05930 [Kitasatospora nipponensis]|uniref:DUF11 domain-containing protein n=1 Tax=Kitasatospora nipponensis TaxID=258049 RepID=A0ABP4G9Z7_9ACTN